MSGQILASSVGSAEGLAREVLSRLEDDAAGGVGILAEIGRERPRPASLFAPEEAKLLETSLAEALPGTVVKTRGRVVHVRVVDNEETAAQVGRLRELAGDRPLAVVAGPGRYRELLEITWDRVLIRAESGVRRDEPGAGLDPLAELVLDEAEDFAGKVELIQPVGRRGLISRLGSRSGQATPLVLGGVFALILGAVALTAISGAVTGKAKAQRTADLAAMSAARSMKDDLPRLLAPPRLPNGLPNPAHMPKPVYLNRARLAGIQAAVINGATALAVSVRFPDAASYAPVRARARIATSVRAGSGGATRRAPPNWAEARVSTPVSMGGVPAVASGGGYSGPLAERQGKGMRPDVAAAFDLMSVAASAAGVTLAINSAFRSDAEQAALFAANPDPTWVAPPGQSLHRCATELDIGPPAAYGWLAANAGRFGFVQRYSWEPWHFGFTQGPAPCSDAGNSPGSGKGDRSAALSRAVPAFTPARYRLMILRAAMKWNVSAALLAAQLYAESGFDPGVVSSAGAQGIAQFMPGTAAMYGLRDPFDAASAIMAQAHLMSDLLGQFGSPALALAAYNAGPGAVSPCNCIPPYAETQAYVTKILAMLGGIGAISPIGMEIELVR